MAGHPRLCGDNRIAGSRSGPCRSVECRNHVYGGYVANNELVLLDQVLKDRQAERANPLTDEKAFELFACEQGLRDFELSPDEIAEGVVGGSNDGGLDGVYVFLNGVLLNPDPPRG